MKNQDYKEMATFALLGLITIAMFIFGILTKGGLNV